MMSCVLLKENDKVLDESTFCCNKFRRHFDGHYDEYMFHYDETEENEDEDEKVKSLFIGYGHDFWMGGIRFCPHCGTQIQIIEKI